MASWQTKPKWRSQVEEGISRTLETGCGDRTSDTEPVIHGHGPAGGPGHIWPSRQCISVPLHFFKSSALNLFTLIYMSDFMEVSS